jgi:hypothetical protein
MIENMLSDDFFHESESMFFHLISDEISESKLEFQLLKEDFIIKVDIMDLYLKNIEDSIFIFKKYNWSLEEFYSLAYGSRMYHLTKIQQYINSVSNE